MTQINKDYNVNFFKPKSEHSRSNMKIITTMFIIWIVAVFGFQILLKVIEKPVTESYYTVLETTWEKISKGDANTAEKQEFVRNALRILGKNIKKKDRKMLSEIISWVSYGLIPTAERKTFIANIVEIRSIKDKINKIAENNIDVINDPEYKTLLNTLNEKEKIFIKEVSTFIALNPNSFRAKLLPLELTPYDVPELKMEYAVLVQPTMKHYLTHNQSVLTDTKFLGFPFHYWYTAEFLLILFVVLCFIYCLLIDKLHIKHSLEEDA